MLERKFIVPNNRKSNRLSDFVRAQAIYLNYPKANEKQRVFSYLRPGRGAQDDGASGGGRIVG
jgi:hypothetical protein